MFCRLFRAQRHMLCDIRANLTLSWSQNVSPVIDKYPRQGAKLLSYGINSSFLIISKGHYSSFY